MAIIGHAPPLMLLLAVATCCLATMGSGAPIKAVNARNGKQPPQRYNFGLSHRVTDLVNMSIAFNGQHKGHVVIGLFGKTVPKAAANFKALCTMERGYVNTTFHRVLRDFIVQGGDFELRNGSGGYSIYNDTPGRRFAAENFNCPHREGSVAMASESRSRLGSQFYIVGAKEQDVKFLNGKHVVFGHVVSGMRVVQNMVRVATDRHDVPKKPLTIAACSTSAYVDPQDDLSKPVKHRMLDDDEFHLDNAPLHKKEGPSRPSGVAKKAPAVNGAAAKNKTLHAPAAAVDKKKGSAANTTSIGGASEKRRSRRPKKDVGKKVG